MLTNYKGADIVNKESSIRTRNANVHFRCSQSEKNLLLERARTARMSVTDYILHLSNRKKIIVIEGLPELVKEINKIGVNVNQLVRMCNKYKSVDEQHIEELCEEQRKIQKAIYDMMNKIATKD